MDRPLACETARKTDQQFHLCYGGFFLLRYLATTEDETPR